jgi:hypothetical protein
MCALVTIIATSAPLRNFRQVGLFAVAALTALACAKGIEIAEGDVNLIMSNTSDAGRGDAGAGGSPALQGTGSNPANPPSPASAPLAASNVGAAAPSVARDAGAGDAGRAEDRPADAGD